MDKLIDKSMNFLFKLAERITSICPASKEEPSKEKCLTPIIHFSKEDKYVEGELFKEYKTNK